MKPLSETVRPAVPPRRVTQDPTRCPACREPEHKVASSGFGAKRETLCGSCGYVYEN
jgi:hypothetical protein